MATPKKTKKRPVGRPKGSGTGKKTREYKISLPLDVADWLDKQPNKSGAIASALRVSMGAEG